MPDSVLRIAPDLQLPFDVAVQTDGDQYAFEAWRTAAAPRIRRTYRAAAARFVAFVAFVSKPRNTQLEIRYGLAS